MTKTKTKNIVRRTLAIILSLCSTFLLCSCNTTNGCIEIDNEATTLEELAYDRYDPHPYYNPKIPKNYRIYIQENGDYKPFLVLSKNNYDGCLLLREHLTEGGINYNGPGVFDPAYYKESTVDKYLNNEYLSRLDSQVQDVILESEIEIAALDTLHTSDDYNETIKRKVFLLSATEISMSNPYYKQGEELVYFDSRYKNSRIAYVEGYASGWATRTSWHYEHVYSIGPEGEEATIPTYASFGPFTGHRPAFVLPKELKVVKTTEVIPNEEVYVLDLD